MNLHLYERIAEDSALVVISLAYGFCLYSLLF